MSSIAKYIPFRVLIVALCATLRTGWLVFLNYRSTDQFIYSNNNPNIGNLLMVAEDVEVAIWSDFFCGYRWQCGVARTSGPFHHIPMSCFCKLLDKHECRLRARCKYRWFVLIHVKLYHMTPLSEKNQKPTIDNIELFVTTSGWHYQ
jgi:hypothetical protein